MESTLIFEKSWGSEYQTENVNNGKEVESGRNKQLSHMHPTGLRVNHELCWLGHGGIGICRKEREEVS